MRLPANGSISMNLDGLITRTTVSFDPQLSADRLTLNGQEVGGTGLQRVTALLDQVRRMAGLSWRAEARSENNFPTGVAF